MDSQTNESDKFVENKRHWDALYVAAANLGFPIKEVVFRDYDTARALFGPDSPPVDKEDSIEGGCLGMYGGAMLYKREEVFADFLRGGRIVFMLGG